jgi:hypothetical protein
MGQQRRMQEKSWMDESKLHEKLLTMLDTGRNLYAVVIV